MSPVSSKCGRCGQDFVTGDVVIHAVVGGLRLPVHVRCKSERKNAAPNAAMETALKQNEHQALSPALAAEPREPKWKSKLEREYFFYLRDKLRHGEILHFAYEPVSLKLAPTAGVLKEAWYTPDFLVVGLDRVVEMHETKGHMREAARVRLLVAAAQHPYYRFRLVKKDGARFVVSPLGD